MLAIGYSQECMLTPQSRNVEDMGDLYTEDFFWAHERLVDLIFITMYFHMYKKLSVNTFVKEQTKAWLSGSTLWLLVHISIFLGLSLCCTHLSDITLTIAANIVWTICAKMGKLDCFIFTDRSLNTDTLFRLSYAHYLVSLGLLVYAGIHAFEMHHDWKDSNFEDGIQITLPWLYATLRYELSTMFDLFAIVYFFATFNYQLNEILNYEIFAWGDVGLNYDVRFLGVAPHWYFRPYMGWLIVCPHHYFGIFGLIYYMVIIYYQPSIKNFYIEGREVNENGVQPSREWDKLHYFSFYLFACSLVYASSILPYGRYYNRVHGNYMSLISYFIIFCYLSFDWKRTIFLANSLMVSIFPSLSAKNNPFTIPTCRI